MDDTVSNSSYALNFRVLPLPPLLLVLSFFWSSQASASEWGNYLSPPKVEFLSGREIRLIEDFTYIDPTGLAWIAPQGSVADGASVPRLAWIALPPLVGKYRDASIIHDISCNTRTRSWESTHKAFYNAMRASGVNSTKAKIMYAAVYHFGPRWLLKEKKKHITPEEAKQFTSDFSKASPGSEIVEEIVEHPASRSGAPKVNLTMRAFPPTVAKSDNEFTRQNFMKLVDKIGSETDEMPITLDDISLWQIR